ncbi:MAG: UbiX family flavin prenyltransferase [Thermoplasmata archaeon]|nr:MAG: UbiX family flavin prenyltransferase [Thermoplasmata archaeon]
MHIIVAITGASGVEYGITLVKYLSSKQDITFDLIISEEGKALISHESTVKIDELASGAENLYDNSDIAAPISSGSRNFDAMVIVPCSFSTLAKIRAGIADNLITRVAAVALKETRKLILVPRETPLNTIQLKNMAKLAKLDVCILPAMPAFYHKPRDIQDIFNFIVGKILDQLNIENDLYNRWGK